MAPVPTRVSVSSMQRRQVPSALPVNPGTAYELLVSPTPLRPGEFGRPFARFELTLQGNFSYAIVLIGSLPGRTLDLITLQLLTAP